MQTYVLARLYTLIEGMPAVVHSTIPSTKLVLIIHNLVTRVSVANTGVERGMAAWQFPGKLSYTVMWSCATVSFTK